MIRKISMPRPSSHQTGKPTKITASGQPGRGRHTAGRVITRAGTTLVVPTLTPCSPVACGSLRLTGGGRCSTPYVELRPLAERLEGAQGRGCRVDARVATVRHVLRVPRVVVRQCLDAGIVRELRRDVAVEGRLASGIARSLEHRPLREHERLVREVLVRVVVEAGEPELLLRLGGLVQPPGGGPCVGLWG